MSAMKPFLRGLSAALLVLATAGAVSGGDAPGGGAAPGAVINTICPVTGRPVDGTIPPVVVVTGKGDKAKRIAIGIAVADAGDTIKAKPQKYLDAAKANKKAE